MQVPVFSLRNVSWRKFINLLFIAYAYGLNIQSLLNLQLFFFYHFLQNFFKTNRIYYVSAVELSISSYSFYRLFGGFFS